MINKNKLFAIIGILGVCAPQVSLAKMEQLSTDCVETSSMVCDDGSLADQNGFYVYAIDRPSIPGCPNCGPQCDCGGMSNV